MDLISIGEVKKIDDSALNIHDQQNYKKAQTSSDKNSKLATNNSSQQSIVGKLGTLVKKVINCCLE